MNKKLILFFVCSSVLIACTISNMGTVPNYSSTYQKSTDALHPQYQLVHRTDTESDLFFSIKSTELLYAKNNGDEDFSSNILIRYTAQASYESAIIVDSGSVRIKELSSGNPKLITGKITLKLPVANSYLLKMFFVDANKNTSASNVIEVNKSSALNEFNFLVKDKATGAPLYRNYLNKKEEVLISYNRNVSNAKPNQFFVRRYKHDFPIAAPPFSILDPKPFNYRPDSVYTLNLDDSSTASFQMPTDGMYNITTDSSQRAGITLYKFYDGFPDVNKAEHLLPPLRYITSKQEYEEMSTAKNKKAAIESFWINCAGTKERAKDIIKKYYSRVQESNKNFTSYIEGWKTDRGMIYLIFGPPNSVYRASGSETWVYGEENNFNSLTFSFNQIDNPFSNNDFYLQRSTIYKNNWYTAVDIWRQGRIYLQN